MRTGCAVVRSSSKRFLGHVLEFMSGRTMDKVLQSSPHLSILTIQSMLFQVSSLISCLGA